MNIENFTTKAQEALQDAANLTIEYEQQQIELPHLVLALVRQEESFVKSIFERLDISISEIEEQMEEKVKGFSKVEVDQPVVSPALNKAIVLAGKHAKKIYQRRLCYKDG